MPDALQDVRSALGHPLDITLADLPLLQGTATVAHCTATVTHCTATVTHCTAVMAHAAGIRVHVQRV